MCSLLIHTTLSLSVVYSAITPNVVLVPRPTSQGHIKPFASLAHFLAASGISVTVVHADPSHSLGASGKAGVSDSRASMIRIEVVPPPPDFLPSVDAKTWKGLQDLLQKLKQDGSSPCCLIADFSLPGCRDVALKFGLPWVVLCTCAASLISLGFHLPEMIARGYITAVDDESQNKMIEFIPGLSPICVMDLPSLMKAQQGLQNPDFVRISTSFEHLKDADILLVNTMHELESNVLEGLRMESSFLIDPVGPLFKMSLISSLGISDLSLLQEDKSCLSWLDQQRESSVLYISFGSVATVEKDVFKELAHGLEASGESFLWVIRRDAHKDKAMTMEELLPEGFLERTGDRGLVILWAPQLAVLAHPSVGAFLTHCGWNSVLESLSNGIPMLGFPQGAEQNTNLKHIVHDWKVGLPLLETDVCNVERTQVQQAVNVIMKGIEGTDVRNHALEWRDIANRAPDGTSMLSLQKLVGDLKNGILKPLIA